MPKNIWFLWHHIPLFHRNMVPSGTLASFSLQHKSPQGVRTWAVTSLRIFISYQERNYSILLKMLIVLKTSNIGIYLPWNHPWKRDARLCSTDASIMEPCRVRNVSCVFLRIFHVSSVVSISKHRCKMVNVAFCISNATLKVLWHPLITPIVSFPGNFAGCNFVG